MRRLAPLMLFAAALILAGCGDAAPPDAAANLGANAGADAAPIVDVDESVVMPADAPPQEEPVETDADNLAAGDCLSAIGKAAADRLVERCVQVSPATRPPCNVANPCALIQGEIDRSCAMYGPGEDRPPECAA